MQILIKYETNGIEDKLTEYGYYYNGFGWVKDIKASYIGGEINRLKGTGIPEITIKNI